MQTLSEVGILTVKTTLEKRKHRGVVLIWEHPLNYSNPAWPVLTKGGWQQNITGVGIGSPK